jgi:hypothetical protein
MGGMGYLALKRGYEVKSASYRKPSDYCCSNKGIGCIDEHAGKKFHAIGTKN